MQPSSNISHQFNRVKVLFVIRRNKQSPDRPCAVYCRITINGIRAEDFSVHERVTPPKDPDNVKNGEWSSDQQKVKGSSPLAQQINDKLECIRARIKALETDLNNKDRPVTADLVKKLFRGEIKLCYNLLELCDQFIAQQKKLVGYDVAPGTLKTYNVRRKNLAEFLKTIKRPSILCEELNRNIAKQFVSWLKTEKKASQNYCRKHIQLVKQTIKFGMQCEILHNDPLIGYTVKLEKPQPIQCLNEAQLTKLQEYKYQSDKLNRIRDMFLFCCYTGLAYVDLQNFIGTRHVRYDEKTGHWLDMQRQKTSQHFLVPLSDKALDLVEKYNGSFPVLSNVKMNVYLKEAMGVLGLPKSDTITWHQARKTFGMLMLNRGIPLETVSRMMGHSSTRITSQLYAQVQTERIAYDTKHLM